MRGCVAAAGIAIASVAGAQERPLTTASQLTSSYAMDLAPSPDGVASVLIRIIAGRGQLFTRDLLTGLERQLTFDNADHEDPAWSPDGKHIAYVRVGSEARQNALYVMDLSTRKVRRLGPTTQSPIHPAWAADGKSILYCTNDDLDPPRKNASEIYRVDVETGRVATVIAGGINTYPVPSPDGSQIAFRRIVGSGSDENSEVFVSGADGRDARNITNNEAWEGWPAWSPDGRTIAFAGNRNAAWQIYLVDPNGSNLRLLAATEGRGTAPKWSADGKTIYFTICRNSHERRGCDVYTARVEQ